MPGTRPRPGPSAPRLARPSGQVAGIGLGSWTASGQARPGGPEPAGRRGWASWASQVPAPAPVGRLAPKECGFSPRPSPPPRGQPRLPLPVTYFPPGPWDPRPLLGCRREGAAGGCRARIPGHAWAVPCAVRPALRGLEPGPWEVGGGRLQVQMQEGGGGWRAGAEEAAGTRLPGGECAWEPWARFKPCARSALWAPGRREAADGAAQRVQP